jgi:ATP-dependent helicase/nuclease subunit B
MLTVPAHIPTLPLMAEVHRHFVGWDRPAIDLAAEWLLAKYGPDMRGVTVALPGARAGRLLLEKLLYAQVSDWQPPQIVTTGRLTDDLVQLERPSASRLLRTLAWEHALRGLGTSDIEALVATRPGQADSKTWRGLANEVRGVFATLSAEGQDFGSVRAESLDTAAGGEQRRWQALGRAQQAAEAFLQAAGLCDPHRGRLEALSRGDLQAVDRDLVLVGVVDAIGLVRQLVGLLDRVSALVFAPEELSAGFDSMGCLVPAFWLERNWALGMQRWRIAVGPDDQARQALDIMSSWKGRYTAEQITIGMGDKDVSPFLERRLTEQGVFARNAEGSAHAVTPPARLLAGLAALLGRGRFADMAALVRHPDVEALLAAKVETDGMSLAEILDGYHGAHLPGPLPEPWLSAVHRCDARREEYAAALGAALEEWLAPLRGPERPLTAWPALLRTVLGTIYGERSFDSQAPADRFVQAGLRGLADALASIEDLPSVANEPCSAAEALELLLSEVATDRVSPRAPELGEPCVEMLGWLELAFDEAPALVVTGFNEGCIPESVKADAWLPDSMRAGLGLPDDKSRLARDLYALQWIVHSREETQLVSGRRTLNGDPLRPSRLAFHGSTEEILQRVRHFLSTSSQSVVAGTFAVAERKLVLPKKLTEPGAWSASAFGDYISSPYLFALGRLARLKTLDDRQKEMDPLVFGTFGHEILRQFGLSAQVASCDSDEISNFLKAALDREFTRWFGDSALPAVQLQRRQLAWRLELFAQHQAERASQGWRIQHVEWKPSKPVSLPTDDGEAALIGVIDRLDYHEEYGWAILDYKIGESAKKPKAARKKDGTWVDLQLPIYAYLAREVIGTEMPRLGYFNLGATETSRSIEEASDWAESDLDQALLAAREIVEAVRDQLKSDQPVFELGSPKYYDQVFADLCGDGILTLEGEEDDE